MISLSNQLKDSSLDGAVQNSICTYNIFRFGSLGDGDAFIHKLLEEKHIKTKEQLYKISLRPTSFDAKEELRARLQDGQTLQPQQQLLGFLFENFSYLDFTSVLF